MGCNEWGLMPKQERRPESVHGWTICFNCHGTARRSRKHSLLDGPYKALGKRVQIEHT